MKFGFNKKQAYVLIFSILVCFIIYKIVYYANGTRSPYPHFLYFPIMFASFFGSWIVSLSTAVLSSVMMSYWFMPLNVAENLTQSHSGWLFRAFMFIAVAIFVKAYSDVLRNKHLQLLRKSRQLTLFRESALTAILELAETRDPDSTGKHLDSLGAYARILLEHLDITEEDKQNIIMSISFHDIGKVAIPDSILLKPGRLTEEEFEIMKKHTIIGGDVLKSIEQSIIDDEQELRNLMKTATDLTYYHHERPDGKGYPKGLKSDDIPFSAKITALCDVYDALSSKRPYKDAFPHEKCVEIIRQGRGTQFDEAIVDCFLKAEDEFRKVKSS